MKDDTTMHLKTIAYALLLNAFILYLLVIVTATSNLWYWHYTSRHDDDADIHRWAHDWSLRYPNLSGWTDKDYRKEWSIYSDDADHRVPGRYPPPSIKGVVVDVHPLSNDPSQDHA